MARIEFALMVALLGCGPTSSDPDPGTGEADAPAGGGADARPTIDAGTCLAVSSEASMSTKPVDIIWVIDNSGSMDNEEAAVQNAMNNFSAFIEAQGIDHHVILIADAARISVPAPLGGSARFLHVNQHIESHDALQHVHGRYADYQAFLRDGASVHLVVVTDDESDWSEAHFNGQMAALTDPGFPDGFTVHAICSEEAVIFSPPPPLPPITGPCTGGLGSGGAAAPGETYIDMVNHTGGVWRSICSSDWNPIFTAVAAAVAIPIALPCAYDIPPPPAGEALDPQRVNLAYTPTGGAPQIVPQVASAAACTGEGWYYDDPINPTRIFVCPATCTRFGSDPTGKVDIQFGCSTIVD